MSPRLTGKCGGLLMPRFSSANSVSRAAAPAGFQWRARERPGMPVSAVSPVMSSTVAGRSRRLTAWPTTTPLGTRSG